MNAVISLTSYWTQTITTRCTRMNKFHLFFGMRRRQSAAGDGDGYGGAVDDTRDCPFRDSGVDCANLGDRLKFQPVRPSTLLSSICDRMQ